MRNNVIRSVFVVALLAGALTLMACKDGPKKSTKAPAPEKVTKKSTSQPVNANKKSTSQPISANKKGDHKHGLHVCPMKSHWHILSNKPGICWVCKMKLVPIAQVKRPQPKQLFRCPMKSHHHIMSSKAGKCFVCKMEMKKFK